MLLFLLGVAFLLGGALMLIYREPLTKINQATEIPVLRFLAITTAGQDVIIAGVGMIAMGIGALYYAFGG